MIIEKSPSRWDLKRVFVLPRYRPRVDCFAEDTARGHVANETFVGGKAKWGDRNLPERRGRGRQKGFWHDGMKSWVGSRLFEERRSSGRIPVLRKPSRRYKKGGAGRWDRVGYHPTHLLRDQRCPSPPDEASAEKVGQGLRRCESSSKEGSRGDQERDRSQ